MFRYACACKRLAFITGKALIGDPEALRQLIQHCTLVAEPWLQINANPICRSTYVCRTIYLPTYLEFSFFTDAVPAQVLNKSEPLGPRDKQKITTNASTPLRSHPDQKFLIPAWHVKLSSQRSRPLEEMDKTCPVY